MSDAFYGALGRVVWRYGIAYLRRRYGRTLVLGTALGLLAIVAGGWLASRPVPEG